MPPLPELPKVFLFHDRCFPSQVVSALRPSQFDQAEHIGLIEEYAAKTLHTVITIKLGPRLRAALNRRDTDTLYLRATSVMSIKVARRFLTILFAVPSHSSRVRTH